MVCILVSSYGYLPTLFDENPPNFLEGLLELMLEYLGLKFEITLPKIPLLSSIMEALEILFAFKFMSLILN